MARDSVRSPSNLRIRWPRGRGSSSLPSRTPATCGSLLIAVVSMLDGLALLPHLLTERWRDRLAGAWRRGALQPALRTLGLRERPEIEGGPDSPWMILTSVSASSARARSSLSSAIEGFHLECGRRRA